ncbi:MAG: hypothetical protein OCC49_08820 [Fibrobacterales bacterium]
MIVVLYALIMNGCLFFGDDEGPQGLFPEIHVDITGSDYEGGAYKVWVTLGGIQATEKMITAQSLKDSLSGLLNSTLPPIQRLRIQEEYDQAFDEFGRQVGSVVAWHSNSGMVAYHTPVIKNGFVDSDTAYILWETLPTPHIDSVAAQGVMIADSTFADTVHVVVNGVYSNPISVEIENIAPRIDSVMISGVSQEVRSENYRELIHLFGRAGQDLYFSLSLSDAYKASLISPQVTLNGFTLISTAADSAANSYEYRLELDAAEIDTIVTLQISDSHSLMFREYRVRVIGYQEIGSLWMSDENDLIKITRYGTEIFRLRNSFNDISSIAIDPNTPSPVWVADEGANALYRFSENGIQEMRDSSFVSPRSVALDHDSKVLWVSSGINNQGVVKSFQIADTTLTELTMDSVSKGYVSDLVVDYRENSSWYVNPVTDTVYMSVDTGRVLDPAQFLPFFTFKNPASIAFDYVASQLWVADSSTLYLMNSDGTGIDSITGFQKISKISAWNGICWIVDTKAGQVVKLSSSEMTSFQAVSSLSPGVQVFSGFSNPIGAVVDQSDNGCWITDTEVGSLVKLDANGIEVLRNRGFNRPSVIARNQ